MGKSKIAGGSTFAINGPVRRHPVFGTRKTDSGDFVAVVQETTEPVILGTAYDNQTSLPRHLKACQRPNENMVFIDEKYNHSSYGSTYSIQLREWRFSGEAAEILYDIDVDSFEGTPTYDIDMMPNGYTVIAAYGSSPSRYMSTYYAYLYVYNKGELVTKMTLKDYGEGARTRQIGICAVDENHILVTRGEGYSVCSLENDTLTVIQASDNIGLQSTMYHTLELAAPDRVMYVGGNSHVLSISEKYAVTANTATACNTFSYPSVQKIADNLWTVSGDRMIARMSMNADNTLNMEYMTQELPSTVYDTVYVPELDLLHAYMSKHYCILASPAEEYCPVCLTGHSYNIQNFRDIAICRTSDRKIHQALVCSRANELYYSWHAATTYGIKQSDENILGVVLQSRHPGEMAKVACIR